MEALPIFLDAIVPSVWAIIISVTAVLFFGEVIPQAICTGPSQLIIAEKVAPFVKLLMFVLGIVCYPLSRLLDLVLGEHDITRYKNDQLKALVKMHSRKALEEIHYHMGAENVGLSQLQTKIIAGAFELTESKVQSIITPFDKVFLLSIDALMNREMVDKIREKGYSRVPIYYGENETFIIGVLLVKTLLGIDVDEPKSIRQLCKDHIC